MYRRTYLLYSDNYFRLHREPLQCHIDSSNWFWPFLDLSIFSPAWVKYAFENLIHWEIIVKRLKREASTVSPSLLSQAGRKKQYSEPICCHWQLKSWIQRKYTLNTIHWAKQMAPVVILKLFLRTFKNKKKCLFILIWKALHIHLLTKNHEYKANIP